jgi:hypothetical protein
MKAMPDAADRIAAALARTAERCAEIEQTLAEIRQLALTLEDEMTGLGAEVGRLNAALAPHRRARERV